MKTIEIEIEKLISTFRIHPDYGNIININLNRVCDRPHNSGYYRVYFNGCNILSHRVAFALYYGRWPEKEIDHINRIKTDNRKCNLREATRSENQCNVLTTSRNTSGFKGVGYRKRDGKWIAKIRIKGKQIMIGKFNDKDDASEAYKKYSKNIHKDFSIH